jgi:hypothetical protein
MKAENANSTTSSGFHLEQDSTRHKNCCFMSHKIDRFLRQQGADQHRVLAYDARANDNQMFLCQNTSQNSVSNLSLSTEKLRQNAGVISSPEERDSSSVFYLSIGHSMDQPFCQPL